MLNTQFSPWPSFTDEELAIVNEVLTSGKVNYWTGQVGREFEREFANFAERSHAIAVSNGTVALDLIWEGLGLKQGDEVIVTPRTFLASASSIVNAGCRPVFVDIDRDSQNVDPQAVAAAIGPKTKAVLAVHLAGWSCEMSELLDIAADANCHVVEDCAQSHGGRYKERSTGAWGVAAGWSFCQDKIMSTGGEGGMVTTSDEALWSKMWSFKDHGKSWNAVYEREHPPGFRWLHESIGTNWRLTEMQSAIGRVQLGMMPEWKQKRQANARAIWSAASELNGLRVPEIPAYIDHACYKCYVFVEPDQLKSGWSRDRIMEAMNAKGVPTFSGSCSEIYLEKAFDGTGYRPSTSLSVAKELGETSLMFLVHPTLTNEEIAKTQQTLRDVMAAASK